MLVYIPYVERAGTHRKYLDELLDLALEVSVEKYGPYRLVKQNRQTVMRRQLLDLVKGENLSVSPAMPSADWLRDAQIVQIPVMKGLASYRLFFAHKKNLQAFNQIDSVESLKQIKIGQLPGWSTYYILTDNGFTVTTGSQHQALFSMLMVDRYQLLMRGIYEIRPELAALEKKFPELVIVDGFAVHTYLPMYFFVSKTQPLLAERIEYGLKKAYATGQFDQLFNRHFAEDIAALNLEGRRIFYIENTNVNPSFFERDKPYLLDIVIQSEEQRRAGRL